MYDKIINILQGAGIGVGFGILGYLKNAPKDEPFEGTKFLTGIFYGAIAGGILGFSGANIDFTSIESTSLGLLTYGGLTVVIERVAKTIWGFLTKQETL